MINAPAQVPGGPGPPAQSQRQVIEGVTLREAARSLAFWLLGVFTFGFFFQVGLRSPLPDVADLLACCGSGDVRFAPDPLSASSTRPVFHAQASGTDFHLIGMVAEAGAVDVASTLSLGNAVASAVSSICIGYAVRGVRACRHSPAGTHAVAHPN